MEALEVVRVEDWECGKNAVFRDNRKKLQEAARRVWTSESPDEANWGRV